MRDDLGIIYVIIALFVSFRNYITRCCALEFDWI